VKAEAPQIVDGTPAYVHKCCENSLKRLGVEVIDLYYQHRVDPKCRSRRRSARWLNSSRPARSAPWLSEASAETIRRAQKTHPIAALQSEYSLWTRDIEAEILPTLRELGIALVPYSPLGRGFLTGKIQSLDDLPEATGAA